MCIRDSIGVAIFVGNSAYEGGNISGAALGLTAVFGNHKTAYVASVASISIAAAALLWLGSYKILERVLLALVCLMAIAFIATVLVVKPDFAAVLKGLVVNIPGGSLTTIIALIGTTVVPYNLFLHSSAITSRWSNASDLPEARFDTIFTIGVGGLITILIVTTAAGVLFGSGISVANAGDMAKQLEPLFGPFAQYMMGLGLFSAGLSSAIAAPLATAFIISETWGLSFQASSWQFRMLALSVVIVGALASLTGIKPLVIIISAQFANGLLLPSMAVFLLYIMNKKEVLGEYCNGWKTNILGAAVVLVTTFLGLWSIARATGVVNS